VDTMSTATACDLWFQAEVGRLSTTDERTAAEFSRRQEELEDILLARAKEEGRAVNELGPAPEWGEEPKGRQPRIIIIGAGVGGLAMGAKLREAGYSDFVIIEKSTDLGGTWHHNNYPGVACDVASYFYSFSFFKNPAWSQMFAPGKEIKQYLSDVADHYDLRRNIRFGTAVDRCLYKDGRWHVETQTGEVIEGDFLVPATGFLHIPKLPDIPGLDSFEHDKFHSSRIPEGYDFSGKRVGVIGNGSSSVQIVSSVVEKAAHVTVFQRTAQWIFPAPNDYYSEKRRRMLEYYPELMQRLFDFFMDMYNTGFGNGAVGDKESQRRFAEACEANLATISDPELRTKLTPDYPVMCKRLIFSHSYYTALQKPNCTLEVEQIDRIEAQGVRLTDGRLVELDVLVLATGFDTHAYCRKLDIQVANGPLLVDAWQEGARSFESIGLAGFPNLLFVGGPYSTVGNLSTMTCAELQVNYIIRLLNEMKQRGATTIMPKQDEQDRFVEEMEAAVVNTVWVTGCRSWYLDERGRIDIWTKSPEAFMERMTSGPDLNKYELIA